MQELKNKAENEAGNKVWLEELEGVLKDAERSAVVEHLVDGLRKGVDAELFQDALERAEQALTERHIMLFEEFRPLDEEASADKASDDKAQEADTAFDVQQFWEKTTARLQQNFSDQRLADAREIEQKLRNLQSFLEGDSSYSDSDCFAGFGSASSASSGCDGLDRETISMLIGMGLGGLAGFGLGKNPLFGVGGTLAGGVLGILLSDVLEELDYL